MNDQDRVDALTASWLAEQPEVVQGEFQSEFELVKRVARLHVLLEEVLLERLRPYGLSKAEYDILSTLRSVGAPYRLRPSELAERILMTSGGISNALRRLEGRGLVGRATDPADARSSPTRLTSAGADLALEAVRDVVGAQTALLRRGARPVTGTAEASQALRAVLIALGDTAPRSRTATALD
ncbi:MarR family winged helix-turn-helix transcriptional regulator [Kitasatospora sp. GAS204B]|uniref:MarR family winged helix-turn-helix transcriptional regulator n=1 Tax=unclassified Kitasatospora TaxID=2633591 RepID=UPI0024730293|nr:MarR family transcriptional regulator [Kitasatospora sp. GAS204B]MDH6117725.1 DNA-binding MarR family transcriptional regulator [Kitasatospora sp. GAS204B]